MECIHDMRETVGLFSFIKSHLISYSAHMKADEGGSSRQLRETGDFYQLKKVKRKANGAWDVLVYHKYTSS
jgi:hypothetical protein